MAIVKPHELKYEWTVSENMLIVRAFRFTFGPNANLTFCRLFWGTLLNCVLLLVAVAVSPLLLIAFGLAVAVDAIKKSNEQERLRKAAQPYTPPPPKVKKEPAAWRLKLLDNVGYAGAKVVYGFDIASKPIRNASKPVGKYVFKPVGRGIKVSAHATADAALFSLNKAGDGFFWTLHWAAAKRGFWKVMRLLALAGVGIVLAFGAFSVIYMIVAMILTIAAHVWFFLAELAGMAILAVAMCGIMMFMTKRAVKRNYHRRFGHYAALPALSSWGLFVLTYRAAKTNTCPRIVVESKPDNSVPFQ